MLISWYVLIGPQDLKTIFIALLFTIIFILKPLTIEPLFFIHNILCTAGVQCSWYCELRMYLFTYLNEKHMQIIYHSKDITALQWSVS